MAASKKYFHDRIVLLLLSTDVFLTIVASLVVALRLSADQGNGYISQYRADLGINAFKAGDATDLLGFIGFALLVFVTHFVLSYKTYRIHRQLSVTILGLGVVLLLFSIVVSNALLALS